MYMGIYGETEGGNGWVVGVDGWRIGGLLAIDGGSQKLRHGRR